MKLDRRKFLSLSAAAAMSTAVGSSPVWAGDTAAPKSGEYGCLVDTTLCVGCRKCGKRLQPAAWPAPAQGIV